MKTPRKTKPRKKKPARAAAPRIQLADALCERCANAQQPISPVRSAPTRAETRAQQILKLTNSLCRCVITSTGRNILHGDCSEHGVPYLLVTAEVYLDGRGAEQEALKQMKEKVSEVSSLLNVGHGVETKVRVLYGKMPTAT